MAKVGFGPLADVALGPGDFLAVTTDGIYEAINAANEEFGIERVEAALPRHP